MKAAEECRLHCPRVLPQGFHMATLYLTFDGVLHPRDVEFRGRNLPRLRTVGHRLFEHGVLLEQVLTLCPQTEVVLHTLWVAAIGYRASVRLLPRSVQARVLGATLPGNRSLRARLEPLGSRRNWLERDLLRRQPESPVLLDYDLQQIPTALKDSACIVDGRRGLSAKACEQLYALLVMDADASANRI